MPVRVLPPFAVLVALLACVVAAPAQAVDKAAQARELFQKGSQALAAGRSQEAIDTFEDAYRAGNSPSLLFYLGEAYRQAGKNGKALEEYQLYLDKMPAGPKHAEAESRVAELKAKAAAAPAPVKRKVAMDDLDLGGGAKKAAPKAKKMELDDVKLAGADSAAQAAAAKKEEAAQAAAKKKEDAAQAAQAAKEEERKRKEKRAAEQAAALAAAAAKPARPARVAVEEPAPKPSVDVSAQSEPSAVAAAPAPQTGLADSAEAARALAARRAAKAAAAPASEPAAVAPAPAAAESERVADAAPAPAPAAPPVKLYELRPQRNVAATSLPRPSPLDSAPAVATIDHPAAAPSDGSAMRTSGIIVGTVGIAALAAGGLFGLGARDAANDVNAAAESGQQYDPGVQSRGQRDQKLEIGFLAGGGAAVIGGVLLYFLSPSASDSRASNEAGSDGLRLTSAGLTPITGGGVSASASLSF